MMPRFKKVGGEEDRRGRPQRRFMDAAKEDLKLEKRNRMQRTESDGGR